MRRGRRTRQVLSAHDPEMRHGRKTAAKPFTGYKLHAAAATEALLTSICVSPANEHDGQHAGTLIDAEPEERRLKQVIGDTAYGNIECREALEERSVEVLAQVASTSPKDGTLTSGESYGATAWLSRAPPSTHRHSPLTLHYPQGLGYSYHRSAGNLLQQARIWWPSLLKPFLHQTQGETVLKSKKSRLRAAVGACAALIALWAPVVAQAGTVLGD